MKKEDTERIQRAYDKLSVGCKVKIIDPHLDHEFGDIGTVEKMCRDLTVYVSVKEKSSWYYWPYKLELIRKFKVGDRVKTVRVTDRCVPKRYENQIAMVTHIDDEDNGYKVKYICDNDTWWLREDNLILDNQICKGERIKIVSCDDMPMMREYIGRLGTVALADTSEMPYYVHIDGDPDYILWWLPASSVEPLSEPLPQQQINATVTIGSETFPLKSCEWTAVAYVVEDEELEGLYPGIYGVPLEENADHSYSYDEYCLKYSSLEQRDHGESFTLSEFFWYRMINKKHPKEDMYSRLMKTQINRLKMRHVKL